MSNIENCAPPLLNNTEEIIMYKKSALEVVKFKIVYNKDDLENDSKVHNAFKPEMAHQIFGDSESIFGYRALSVEIFFSHNSANCFVDINFTGKINDGEKCKADDIMAMLNLWLPENYKTNKDEFISILNEEKHDSMFGTVLDSFKIEHEVFPGKKQMCDFKMTVCDTSNEEFKNFHQRFETLIIWYIDGANFIDLEDTRWLIFYIYEEFVDESTNVLYRSPVGFCTVYKFYLYPSSIRPRISQFFILPTHQRKGLGTRFYGNIFKYLRELSNAEDITVEEPTQILQKLRDFSDGLIIYKYLKVNNINITTKNQKQINEIIRKNKICKRQAQRVFDILECLQAHKNGYNEYIKFTESIKNRISKEIKKESRGSKKLCNLDRIGIVTEPIDRQAALEVEYKKYLDSLERPVKRLGAHLEKEN